jgi:hypothetical protein
MCVPMDQVWDLRATWQPRPSLPYMVVMSIMQRIDHTTYRWNAGWLWQIAPWKNPSVRHIYQIWNEMFSSLGMTIKSSRHLQYDGNVLGRAQDMVFILWIMCTFILGRFNYLQEWQAKPNRQPKTHSEWDHQPANRGTGRNTTVVPAMSSHLISGCKVAAHDRFISMINDKYVYK